MTVISAMSSGTHVLDSLKEEWLKAIVLPHIATLRKIRLFEGLSDEQLEAIVPSCCQIHSSKGRVLLSEGDESTKVFVVLEGEVCLEVELFMGYHLRPKTITIKRVGKSDAFGWSTLIEPHCMTMTARCTREADIIVVNRDDLKALMKAHPDIGLIVMENVTKIVYDRLVHARQRMIAEFGLEAMYQAHRAY